MDPALTALSLDLGTHRDLGRALFHSSHPIWGASGLDPSRTVCSVLRAGGKGAQVSMEKPGESRGAAPGSTEMCREGLRGKMLV